MVEGAEDNAEDVSRFDVVLVSLDPTVGAEIRKARPCLVISPDEMNRHLATVIVAPMTTRRRKWPSRCDCTFRGTKGQVVVDQIRTVDRARVVRRLGRLGRRTSARVLELLQEMFAP